MVSPSFPPQPFFSLQNETDFVLLRLHSEDRTNRLTRGCVHSLHEVIGKLSVEPLPLVIAGNTSFFSAGAELKEIAALDAPTAYEFSKMGQALMNSIDHFPAPVYAAISGYCMGGGLDLALACDHRIASPHSNFGHRGAALGLMTGWGGTQRLPRLVGKARALQMFIMADKITALQASRMGLIEAIAEDPVAEAVRRIRDKSTNTV
jgi:enoyl-CoA hydratase/carnithine racemase